MFNNLILRPAEEHDLPEIVRLFIEDDLGATREALADPLPQSYYKAFQEIRSDKNQTVFVLEDKENIIATYHLTFMPSLSFKGSKRLNIENFHVDKRFQNQGIGTWMITQAIAMGKEKGCGFIQLTTNKKRTQAKTFYEKLGFIPSHEGMKLYLT